jgi:hypothetical protein
LKLVPSFLSKPEKLVPSFLSKPDLLPGKLAQEYLSLIAYA